jgi:hypothetical protein
MYTNLTSRMNGKDQEPSPPFFPSPSSLESSPFQVAKAHSFTHASDKYLLSAYLVPSMVLGVDKGQERTGGSALDSIFRMKHALGGGVKGGLSAVTIRTAVRGPDGPLPKCLGQDPTL